MHGGYRPIRAAVSTSPADSSDTLSGRIWGESSGRQYTAADMWSRERERTALELEGASPQTLLLCEVEQNQKGLCAALPVSKTRFNTDSPRAATCNARLPVPPWYGRAHPAPLADPPLDRIHGFARLM